jgi:phage gpG-like protein
MSNYTDNTDRFIRDLIALSNGIKGITKDIAVMAADMFDRNFERESFFGEKWTPSKYVAKDNAKRGKNRFLLQKTGHLRKSIRYSVSANTITFSSNLPYAAIHNEGGDIAHPGGTAYAFNKKKNQTIWISNRKAEGKDYKRTGPHTIPIPQRQFVGDHRVLEDEIGKLIEEEISKAFK